MDELGGIREGEVDGVGYYGGGGGDENDGRPGVAGDAVGNWFVLGGAADGENCGGAQAVENPADENYAADEFGEFAGAGQDRGPDSKSDYRICGRAEARMDFG